MDKKKIDRHNKEKEFINGVVKKKETNRQKDNRQTQQRKRVYKGSLQNKFPLMHFTKLKANKRNFRF